MSRRYSLRLIETQPAVVVTTTLPLPLAPAVMVIQLAPLVADHPQPVPAVTFTLLLPPVAAGEALVAERV